MIQIEDIMKKDTNVALLGHIWGTWSSLEMCGGK